MNIPRLRKIPQAIQEIKQQDPNTAITEYLLYELMRRGHLSQIKLGNAWLVNLEELYDFFKTKEEE